MAKRNSLRKPKSKKGKRFEVPEIKDSHNYDLDKPIFSFGSMEYQGKCCISGCGGNEKSNIVDSLLRFSQLTWREIKRLPREVGFEKIPLYRFKVPIPKILTPETTILVMRYDNDGGRLAGYREKNIYHIVLAGKGLYAH